MVDCSSLNILRFGFRCLFANSLTSRLPNTKTVTLFWRIECGDHDGAAPPLRKELPTEAPILVLPGGVYKHHDSRC